MFVFECDAGFVLNFDEVYEELVYKACCYIYVVLSIVFVSGVKL